jgi:predicted ATPase/transcriptional regulator with XRE-family HTH domain
MTDEVAPNPAESVGDLLRRYRVDAGFTQEDLAERAAISARTVSDIERGLRTSIYRDTATRLAQALRLEGSARAVFQQAARRAPAGVSRMSPIEAASRLAIHPIPAPLTRLIGRADELTAVVGALRSGTVRVLTLVGPGGIGKTRLAIEAADKIAADFADGACFVSLAVTDDATMMPSLMARELGLLSVRKPMHEAVRDHLRDREMLVVLDTFEHLLPAAAYIAELATACRRLSFLVTSRIPLHIRGEHEVSLTPLAMPELPVDAATLDSYPATALFLERGRAVKREFVLDADTATTIVEICRRLDGLPLAIELAAVRLRHLPLATLATALDHRLDLLVGGPRDLPPRLQTMRDAIAWSYELLPPAAQRVFRAVSIFAGGWTVAAAEAISGTDGEELELLKELTTLVDNHLVTIDDRGGSDPRYRMLDVIREYALEQVERHAETELLARRHALHFADVAEAAEREQGAAGQEPSYRRLQREQDNMRAALGWAIAAQEPRLAQRIAAALWLYWRRHGDYVEGRGWLDQVLDLASQVEGASDDHESADTSPGSDRALRRKVMWGAAWIGYYQADYAHVRRLGDELLRLAEQDRDRVGIRNGLTIQALVAMAEQRFDDALAPLEESVTICRQSCPPWLLATSLLVLGQATLHGTDLARSRSVLQEALSLYEHLGDRLFIARTNGYLGYVALLTGRTRTAERLFRASLRGFNALGERFGIAEELQAMATLRAAQEQDEYGAQLAGAAQMLWNSMSAQMLASDRPITSRYLDPARRRLGSAAWQSAWRQGQAMPTDSAIRLALRDQPATRASIGPRVR